MSNNLRPLLIFEAKEKCNGPSVIEKGQRVFFEGHLSLENENMIQRILIRKYPNVTIICEMNPDEFNNWWQEEGKDKIERVKDIFQRHESSLHRNNP